MSSMNGHSRHQPLNLLMVDDHEENLIALEAILDPGQFHIVKARSGREALRCVLRQDFAVILLDVRMPDIDGFETARLVRERERSRRTPIIFLTAVASEDEQIFKGYASGAVDYISKPFIPEILQSKVRVFAELFEKSRDLESINESLEELVAERTHELRIAEERFRGIFENAMEGIFQASDNGRYVMVNPAMARILGYSSPEKLIASVENIGEDIYVSRESYAQYRAELRENGSVASFESQVRRRDGSLIWISESTHTLRDPNGGIIGYEGVVEDITTRKRAATETAARNRDLESLLYVISHDLREPIRAVSGYTDIVLEDFAKDFDPEGRELLQRVMKASQRLTTLLDNIQTLIYAQRLGPPDTEVDFGEIVREVLTLLEKKIGETRAQIRVVENLPRLRADRDWARQAMMNLIANALKFTQRGKAPEIEIVPYIADGATPRAIGIMVRDRGPGVLPEHSDRIFELFRREVGRDIEGTGAGLAIVRQVAERHGGRAWVQARKGGGSNFVITFGG